MTRQQGWARQLPSGMWQGQYRDALGKVRSAGTHARKEAAIRAARMEIAKIEAGVWEDPSLGTERFEVFAQEYFDLRLNSGRGLKPKGRQDLESCIRVHLNPYFGTAELRSIKRSHVQDWASVWMPGKGSSPHTTRKAKRYLHAILREAFLQEKIARNPATGIDVKTSASQVSKIIISPSELLQLADALPSRFQALVLIAGFVGMRAAECAGLRVNDLNLKEGVAIIRATNSEVGGVLHLTDTKTSVAREVPLAPWMCRLLDSHIARFPSPDGFVFTSMRGSPYRHSDFYKRFFKPALVTAGINPSFQFRWLRDTAVSNGRHIGGQPAKVMQKVVGHKQESMTQNTYTQLPPDGMEGVKHAWEKMFEDAAVASGSVGAARLLHSTGSELISLGARTYVPAADLR